MSIDGPYLKVREWGSEESTTMPGTSRSDGSVTLRDHEQVLDRRIANIRLNFYNKGPDGKALESQFSTSWMTDEVELTTTTQRLIYVKHDWAKGNQYIGLGGGGATVALVAGAVSKHKAKARSAGTALMGQIPFQWPLRIFSEPGGGLLGRSKTHVYVPISSKTQFLRFGLQIPNAEAPGFVRLFAAAVNRYRLNAPSAERASDDVKAQLARQAEKPTPNEHGSYELTWSATVRL